MVVGGFCATLLFLKWEGFRKWLLFPCLGFHGAHEEDRELGTEPYRQM